MTQDVQPLTWQKRTNIEEHMQFFSKINEIIANLAPTVNEAEQAIASANAAIATANAASANADAASQQAQTAASTVAGYDARLTAVEADYLKKTGAAQTVTSQIMVPTTATGARDEQVANGTRIQNDLANYAQMMRLTGNQTFSGIKKAGSAGFFRKQSSSLTLNPPSSGTITDELYVMEDISGTTAVQLFNSYTEGAQTIYQIATKYPFVENGNNSVTTGILWLATYADHASIFLRFTDKNGTSHMKEIGRVNQTD